MLEVSGRDKWFIVVIRANFSAHERTGSEFSVTLPFPPPCPPSSISPFPSRQEAYPRVTMINIRKWNQYMVSWLLCLGHRRGLPDADYSLMMITGCLFLQNIIHQWKMFWGSDDVSPSGRLKGVFLVPGDAHSSLWARKVSYFFCPNDGCERKWDGAAWRTGRLHVMLEVRSCLGAWDR